jgi:phytoene dehydrogenase-like protein
MQIHFALDTPPNWPDERLLKAGIIHLTPGVNGVSRAVNEAVRQQIPAEPTIVIGQHTALDPSRSPDGTWTIWIQLQEMPNTPQGDAAGQIDTTGGWTEAVKNAVADRVIDRIEAVAPGFRQSILHQHVISPKDLNDINPNLVGGDPYSGTCTIDQFLIWRPFKEMLPHHTPFKNLYHIGASTHPGPGLSGGSGYMVARKISRRS